MLTFKEYLQKRDCYFESYKDVTHDDEWKKVQDINMTAKLPMAAATGALTRGFHINTIVGRMMMPWAAGLRHAPLDVDQLEVNPEKAYRWRISKTDSRPNDRYKAAYDMFKQEIANAVNALPYKEGINVITGQPEEVTKKSKDFLVGHIADEQDMIESLEKAFKIYTDVFGNPENNREAARNFHNFLQLAREEFMTLGEMLPSMEEDDGERMVDNSFTKRLDAAIKKFRAMV